jgi:NAD+ diphosphatase
MLNPLPVGFAGNPLDRVDHFRRDPAQLVAARLHPAARFLVLDRLKPVLAPGGRSLLWVERSAAGDGEPILLGLDTDGAPRFAVAGSATGLEGVAIDARQAAMTLEHGEAGILAQARALVDWHQRHGFCAACGAPTRMVKGGHGRTCDGCAAEHFPRVDPVVIMLAERDGLCLLGRQPRFPRGFLSALAGFVEPGESIEEAVARELFEEAGIRVGAVRYLASQPWPFPSSLMIGAIAQSSGFELTLDTQEIEEARWVSRAEVAAALAGHGDWQAPPPLAIAHTLLEAWVHAGERERAVP